MRRVLFFFFLRVLKDSFTSSFSPVWKPLEVLKLKKVILLKKDGFHFKRNLDTQGEKIAEKISEISSFRVRIEVDDVTQLEICFSSTEQ